MMEGIPVDHPSTPLPYTHMVSRPKESENGAGFITGKEIIPARVTLEEMGHPQGPTPLKFDNKCATGIINDEI